MCEHMGNSTCAAAAAWAYAHLASITFSKCDQHNYACSFSHSVIGNFRQCSSGLQNDVAIYLQPHGETRRQGRYAREEEHA